MGALLVFALVALVWWRQRSVIRMSKEIMISEERYAFAVSGTAEGLWDWDIRTGEDYLSPRWKEILGYQDHELDNRLETFSGALHPDDHDRAMEAVRAHLEERVPYDLDFRLRCKDGSYIWVHAKGQAVWDELGTPLRMAGSISDIEYHSEHRWLHADGKVVWTHEDIVPVRGSDGEVTVFIGTLTDISGRKRAEEEKEKLEVQLRQPDGLPKIKCHGQQIQQVLMNLLTNARDALNERYPGHNPDKIMMLTVRAFDLCLTVQ